MRRLLGEQITEDFRNALEGDNSRTFVPTQQLAEACRTVDVLDPKVKKGLLKWFVGRELAEYPLIFEDSQEDAWLDKIDNR